MGLSRLVPGIHKTNLSHFTCIISQATITHVALPLAPYIHQLTTSTSTIPVYFMTLVKVSETLFRFWKDQTHQIVFCLFHTAQLTTCTPHADLTPMHSTSENTLLPSDQLSSPSTPLPSLTLPIFPTIYLTIIHPNTTMSQPVVPLMPTHGDHGVPQFDPDKSCELYCFSSFSLCDPM